MGFAFAQWSVRGRLRVFAGRGWFVAHSVYGV